MYIILVKYVHHGIFQNYIFPSTTYIAAGKKGRGPAFLHNRGPTNESVDRQH